MTFDLRHQDHPYHQNNILQTPQHYNPFYLLILLCSRVSVSTPAGLYHYLSSDYTFLFQVKILIYLKQNDWKIVYN